MKLSVIKNIVALVIGVASCGYASTNAQDKPADNMQILRDKPQDFLVVSGDDNLAMAQIACNTTWEALQAPGWNEEQLHRLQQKWESTRFVEPMEDALVMERAMGARQTTNLENRCLRRAGELLRCRDGS